MVLSFFIAYYAKGAVEENLLTVTPLPVVNDVIRDWETVPFVSLAVRMECEEGEVNVFTRTWLGTERGCEIDGSAAPRDTWKDSGNLLADCEEVLAIAPIE